MTIFRSLVSLVLVCLLGATVWAQDATRRIYVTAVDRDGNPITDLLASDLTVKEGNANRTILRADPAVSKMSIAILVDDNGTGLFRVAVARFIESLLGRAEFSISTVTGQTLKLVDYTSEAEALSAAVRKLGPRPATNDGNQLLDGITGTSLDMAKREAGRPIILALTVGGDDVTPIQPRAALDQLRRSGAQLYVVSVMSSAMRAMANPTRPSDMLNENLALGAVLGDGPKRSGGTRQEIAAVAGVDTGLVRLAEQLKHQYLVEYVLDGAKPSDRVSVSLKRKNVTLRAPTHVPDKL
jgi:VWFA-related protein